MTIFKLPDLGEGLLDAEIHEWYVKENDEVNIDQPLVAMETAKAIVDIPSPYTGKICKLYGKHGDIIRTDAPLIEFAIKEDINAQSPSTHSSTVVGNLEESHIISVDTFSINHSKTIKTTPTVRALAKKLNINLEIVVGTGEYGVITRSDVEQAAAITNNCNTTTSSLPLNNDYVPIRGTRRAMLHSMVASHQEIVPVSLFDEVDINAWPSTTDITIRLIQAIIIACKKEPILNSWFDGKNHAIKNFDNINLGLAIDSQDGLFVPVIHHAEKLSTQELRSAINNYKQSVQERTLSADKFQNATISLSNFGKFAGRFASPIIVPPQVAILAGGKIYSGVVAELNEIKIHHLLPLSLTFDHRAITGGEASRFLSIIMQELKKSSHE